MVFYPPSWVPKLPLDPPDTVSISDFMLSNDYGRRPLEQSRNIFTCGLTGKSYTPTQTQERVRDLARGLRKEFGWSPNTGTEWDKVAAVFSLNAIDSIILAWAIHKLGGIDSPANAAYSAFELEHQIRDSGAKYIFTCIPLLETTLKVADKLGLPRKNVYLIELPPQITGGKSAPAGFKTLDDLVQQGKTAPSLEALKWSRGEGGRRTAFLCYSSGTSGLPKGVMISHRNVIANTMQFASFDSYDRQRQTSSGATYGDTMNNLGLLPFSHIYGLVAVCHSTLFMGDGIIVLPKFEFGSCMQAIQDYKIGTLYLVPPIIIAMVNNKEALKKYDFSSVKGIFTGAAPLGPETGQALKEMYPSWAIRQGYGLTETCTVVSSTSGHDILPGSSGSLLPGFKAKLVTVEGTEITDYDQPGELWASGPSVVLGYLHNDSANEATFTPDGYMRTGDEAVIRKSSNGYEHVVIVDRIKELIKVKGMQVAPAELEAHLLSHPAVADATVIPIPDDEAGERPKAYVVLSQEKLREGMESEPAIKREVIQHVQKHKSKHKWLKEVEFIDVIPKSPSGKILRRLLRDKDGEQRRQKGAKL